MIGRSALTTAALVLTINSSVVACASHNKTGIAVTPGGGAFSELAGPAMVILAAFLKRPFVSLAGIGEHALWRSLQSTLFSSLASTVAGIALLAFAWKLGPISLVALLAIPLLTALVDWAWLNRAGMGAVQSVAFGWLAVGNVFAAVVIATLPVWMSAFGFNSGAHLVWVRSVVPMVGIVTSLAAVSMLIAAFALAPRDPNAPSLYRAGRAFEVIMRNPSRAEAAALVHPGQAAIRATIVMTAPQADLTTTPTTRPLSAPTPMSIDSA